MRITSRIWLIALMAAVLTNCNLAFAQELFPSKYYVELGSGLGIASLNDSKTNFATRDLTASFGYDLSSKFTVRLPLALSVGLFENGKKNTSYQTNGTIGLGAGYNFIVRDGYRWQLSAEAGHTLKGKSDAWKYFYYDVSGKFYLGEPGKRTNAFVGIGIRQYISEIKASPDYVVPYLSLGFRLNHLKRK
jgi:hypothetical protein